MKAMPNIVLVPRKTTTFHDFPYSSSDRKCPHCWIINITPPGPNQCIHNCVYCYARDAVYATGAAEMKIYSNLPELIEKDLQKMSICPPVSISTITDPCQDIPELKAEVMRLITLLMKYGITFVVTAKGDASFLLEMSGFAAYEPKIIAVTIEGTADIVQLLSPQAPAFEKRLDAVRRLSSAGIRTIIRLDPLFKHLFAAWYGENWFAPVEKLLGDFGDAGVSHIIAGTGRLSKRRSISGPYAGTSMWQRMHDLINKVSPEQGGLFAAEYAYENSSQGRGYMLRKDLRLTLHKKLRAAGEAVGMTYAVCQEMQPEYDSSTVPTCHGVTLPIAVKGADERVHSIPGCSAYCHLPCAGRNEIPCRRPQLVSNKPLSMKVLG